MVNGFVCFSFVAVKMGLKKMSGKKCLYEMIEVRDELRGSLKFNGRFLPPAGSCGQRTGV